MKTATKPDQKCFSWALILLKKTVKSTGTIAESECSRLYVVRRTEVFRQRTDL